jgi:hypothetical protein
MTWRDMVRAMLRYGARQRYRRKRCGKTFNDLTQIPLAGKQIDDGKTVWIAGLCLMGYQGICALCCESWDTIVENTAEVRAFLFARLRSFKKPFPIW